MSRWKRASVDPQLATLAKQHWRLKRWCHYYILSSSSSWESFDEILVQNQAVHRESTWNVAKKSLSCSICFGDPNETHLDRYLRQSLALLQNTRSWAHYFLQSSLPTFKPTWPLQRSRPAKSVKHTHILLLYQLYRRHILSYCQDAHFKLVIFILGGGIKNLYIQLHRLLKTEEQKICDLSLLFVTEISIHQNIPTKLLLSNNQ